MEEPTIAVPLALVYEADGLLSLVAHRGTGDPMPEDLREDLKRVSTALRVLTVRAVVDMQRVRLRGQPSFTCPRCGRTSHNPHDAREGYCGACHDWTG